MTETKRAPKDIAILSGPTEDGRGARVVRIREGGDVSAGEIRPVREGEPLNHTELVRLHPLDPHKRVCAVEVLHASQQAQRAEAEESSRPAKAAKRSTSSTSSSSTSSPTRRSSGGGPARVSNAKYRKNWSIIFGSKDDPSDGDWSIN